MTFLRTAFAALVGVGAAMPAAADTLRYEYVGNLLALDVESAQDYVDAADAEIGLSEEEAESILGSSSRRPLDYAVIVDQDALPTGSVRNQTVEVPFFNFPLDGVEVETDVFGTAFESASITFNGGGRIVGYSFDAFGDFDETSAGTFGDVIVEDPFFLFPDGPSIFYSGPPGSFTLVSGEVAPIPVPAALPLLAAGLGALALASRRGSRRRDA